jgi:hypothetical protein
MALDRYRAHPVRYFSLVTATLLLLGLAGGFYVYLDADKRASERALGLLQFCHLALRNDEAKDLLAEQRRNLTTIESTAGNIRSLVDKLPPEEQKKAREIVAQINSSLALQGKLVNDWIGRSDETARQARDHAQLVERGLSAMETNLGALKSLPEQLGKLDGKLDGEAARLTALKTTVDALAARPACPACVCDAPKPAAVAASTNHPSVGDAAATAVNAKEPMTKETAAAKEGGASAKAVAAKETSAARSPQAKETSAKPSGTDEAGAAK